MKYVRSQTDFLVDRIVRAVELPPDDPYYRSTDRLIQRMRKKQEEGSWNP